MSVTAQSLFEKTCKADGGKVAQEITCPNSEVKREGEFCIFQDKLTNSQVFFNGCSASVPGFDDLFFKACYYHDHCYHHEPATNGMSKRDCDQKFKAQLYNICESIGHSMKRGYTCNQVVDVTYLAVKFGGQSSWECSNTEAQYPIATSILDYLPVID